MAHYDRLHQLAYPEADPDQAGSEPAASQSTTHAAIDNQIQWDSVRLDGAALGAEDQVAARDMVAAAIGALALPRPDMGRLVFVLSGAMRAGARGTSAEAGQAALVAQLGTEGARRATADANAVLRHLDGLGIKASEALIRSGAANSAELVRELAAIAPRLQRGGKRMP
jgi:hypothetical protein